VQRCGVHDYVGLPEGIQDLRPVSNVCLHRFVWGLQSAVVHQDRFVPDLLQRRARTRPRLPPPPVISTLTLPTSYRSGETSSISWRSSSERRGRTEAAAFASTWAGLLAPGIATETAGWLRT
jgi:hypothetical protein